MRMGLTGRVAVAFLAVGLSVVSRAQTLREEADRQNILVGTAARAYLLSEAQYAAVLAREYNLLEPENELKWEAIHPAEHVFDFIPGDQLVDFARFHHMQARGHCLVWGIHLPRWVNDGHYSPQQLRELLHSHISTVMSHYRGRVFAWDVINEAIDENGHLRSSPWYDQPGIGEAGHGTAYIEQAFRWAHEADPEALLFYNDGGGEMLNAKSDAVFAMAKDFRSRGVPLHGIGLQMHIMNLDPDLEGIATNIRRFTSLGLQVHITELDVALPVDPDGKPRNSAHLQRQAEIYRGIVRACVTQPRCTAIQTWGFTDKYSWIRSWTRGAKGSAVLLDRGYLPKPAYQAFREGLSQNAASTPAPPQ